MNRYLNFKYLIVLAIAMTQAIICVAIPAIPHPITVTQPDGTSLTIIMSGDERGSVMTTSDGYAVVQDPSTGRYEFATFNGISFSSLGIAATNPNNRTQSEVELLSSEDRNSVICALSKVQKASQARKAPQKKVKISNYPTLGRQKALVILVEFEDTKFTTMPDAYDYYNRMLNEEGFTWENGAHGSARDFYLASSDGKFDPEFVVVGPITLDKPSSYYGGDSTYLDEKISDMILETSKAIDNIVDFSEFDADGDAYVDNIYIFYAGYGQADSGLSNAIWPHSGMLESDWGQKLILDDVHINRYACSNEIRYDYYSKEYPVGIGTFVHEFGHVLGIADHYDTLYTSGRVGVQEWDTMAAASYHNNQNTPPLFNAFERAELGWLEYADIHSNTPGWLTLPSLDIESKAYRVVVEGTDGLEYFVLENRRKQGWDKYLPGEGMLVWHVDIDEQRWWDNTVNTDNAHQYFDLVEADGKETDATYSSDPFPGKSNITSFSFINWDGEEEFSLDHISQTDGVARLILGGTDFMPEPTSISIERVGGQTVHFSWHPVDDAQYYTVSLRDEAGEAVGEFDNLRMEEAGLVKLESLTPLTTYNLSVTTHMGSYRSETVTETFSTGDICFFEKTPEISSIDAVGDSSFTIAWLPMTDATDYTLTLDKMNYDQTLESVSDFSLMEQPWHSSSEKYNKALFGEKSPSLQLDADEDYLEFATDEGKISELSFWVRSQTSSNAFRVERLDSDTDEWILMASEKPTTGGAVFSYEVDEASAVRIVFEKKSGYLLIDDAKCVWRPLVWNSMAGYEDFRTGGECVFEPVGLDGATTYRVSLTAINDAESSRTASCRVTTSDALGAGMIQEPGSGSVKAVYDIYGNPVGNGYKGIIISVFEDGSSRKSVKR